MEFYGKHVLLHDIISTINIVNNNNFSVGDSKRGSSTRLQVSTGEED